MHRRDGIPVQRAAWSNQMRASTVTVIVRPAGDDGRRHARLGGGAAERLKISRRSSKMLCILLTAI